MDQAITVHQEGDEIYNVNNGKLHQAPLISPKFVLDIGCGSGNWTTSFAKAYPSCQVLGVDMDPRPNPSDIPNCTFASGDIQKDWSWLPEQEIDFIHIRGLVGFVTSWPDVFRRALSCLAPGGWLEIADISYETFSDDDSLARAKGLLRFDEMFAQTLAKMGEKVETPFLIGQIMTDSGFQNLAVTKRRLPFSDFSDEPDMKEIARDSPEFQKMDATVIAERGIQPMLNLCTEEVRSILSDALGDMSDTSIHAYRHALVFSGQKVV